MRRTLCWRRRLFGRDASAHAFQFLDATRRNGCADQAMLFLQSLRQKFFIKPCLDQILIGRPLAGQNRAP
jgi:hypothetical protein